MIIGNLVVETLDYTDLFLFYNLSLENAAHAQ